MQMEADREETAGRGRRREHGEEGRRGGREEGREGNLLQSLLF